jgi:hypothetical protein
MQSFKQLLQESKYSKWIGHVKDDVEDAIMNDDISDDIDDVMDYLKTSYRAENPEKEYDKMVKDIAKWYKKKK